MKKALIFPTLFILLLFVQCNPENEEDLYYEPLVEGIFNISVDQSERLDFTIEPNKSLTVNGKFSNGIPFTVEFEANALRFNEAVEASIQPVTGLLDMPSEFKFNFGFVFSPEGIEFNKPGKMTIELPPDIDVSEFKGFYFQGGVPYGNSDAEIWSVKLTPLLFQSEGGKKLAVFEIPHFSGFVGVSGGDFKCGNPLAAEMCEELKEILACYTTGKESLSGDDQKKVNKALKDWMNAGMDWLEEHPEQLENMWDVEDAIRELLCWKSAVLMFNSTMAPFQNELNRIGDLFSGVLIDRLVSVNQECSSMTDMYAQYGSFETNFYFINLVEELQNGGFLNEDPNITILSYCDEIATNFYMDPFLDTTLRQDIRLDQGYWMISLGAGDDPVARSRSFTVYATNLLGEPVELTLGKEYTIENINSERHTLDGNIITEVIQTCYGVDANNNPCCPYACYGGGYCFFDVVLTSSGDYLHVQAGRYGW
jgi:hypothetical protein